MNKGFLVDKEIKEIARKLGGVLKQEGLKIVTAESCTGGGISQAITEIPGSSAWFDRGFVTYSNDAKVQMLKVNQSTLEKYHAVSKQVAIEMVNGALANSDADMAVSVTGIAGPDGGSEEKPIGTVFIALALRGGASNCFLQQFSGDRSEIREQTILFALNQCLNSCSGN